MLDFSWCLFICRELLHRSRQTGNADLGMCFCKWCILASWWQSFLWALSQDCCCSAGSLVQLPTALLAICSLGFFRKWCADGGEVWKMLPYCAKKLQSIRISRGLSAKIAFNIHFWVWKPEINSSSNVYLKYKTYWQQSFWYWDTELLQLVQESFAG